MALSNHSFCISVMFLQVALQNNSASKIFNTSVSTPRRPHRHNLSRNCSPLQYLQHLTAKRLSAGLSQSWNSLKRLRCVPHRRKKCLNSCTCLTVTHLYVFFFFHTAQTGTFCRSLLGTGRGPQTSWICLLIRGPNSALNPGLSLEVFEACAIQLRKTGHALQSVSIPSIQQELVKT